MWGARRDEARPGRQGSAGFLSKWVVLVLTHRDALKAKPGSRPGQG
jgi:hypothetical protein